MEDKPIQSEALTNASTGEILESVLLAVGNAKNANPAKALSEQWDISLAQAQRMIDNLDYLLD